MDQNAKGEDDLKNMIKKQTLRELTSEEEDGDDCNDDEDDQNIICRIAES